MPEKEIDFKAEFSRIMIEFASDHPDIRNTIEWLNEIGDSDDESEVKYVIMARKVCRYFALDPDNDVSAVFDRCEEKLMAETFYDQA